MAAAQGVATRGGVLQALSVEYADGHTSMWLLEAPGGSNWTWTPNFPRIAGQNTSRNGLALEALQIDRAMTAQDVIATVTLLYGASHQLQIPVATVHVTPDAKFRVDLTAYGVESITLSLAAVSPVLTHAPEVTSVSTALKVRIEPFASGVPAYRVVVVNDSPAALKAFYLEAYSGDQRVLSGMKGDPRDNPLSAPHGEYAYTVRLSTHQNPDGTPAWALWDRIAITAVVWEDGVVEGDPGKAIIEFTVDRDRDSGIQRVLDVLHRIAAGTSASPATVRAQLPATFGSALRDQVRAALLDDLDEFDQDPRAGNPGAFGQWLAAAIAEYEAWLARTRTAWINYRPPARPARSRFPAPPAFTAHPALIGRKYAL